MKRKRVFQKKHCVTNDLVDDLETQFSSIDEQVLIVMIDREKAALLKRYRRGLAAANYLELPGLLQVLPDKN